MSYLVKNKTKAPNMRKRTTPLPLQPHRVTVADFQAVSGMGRDEVYDQVSAGNLPAVKIGRRILIDLPSRPRMARQPAERSAKPRYRRVTGR
jgi:hypothetical protein